jgi:hypothetical protein
MLASEIMLKFKDFTEGYRLVMLIKRMKHEGNDYEGFRDTTAIKKITSNSEEFERTIKDLLEIQKTQPDYRIYSSVNSRNIDEVLFNFKYNILKTDYYSEIERDNFYFNIQKRFLSSFMLHQCRESSNFLIDIDTKDEKKILEYEDKLFKLTKPLLKYESKHGWHIITQPFDSKQIKGWGIKKDGFLLLNY